MKNIPYTGPNVSNEKNYSARCEKAPLPEGYRFLKLGEIIKKDDYVVAWGQGPWQANKSVGKVINEDNHPFIRETVKRGPKGQFVSAKPAPKKECLEAEIVRKTPSPAPKVVLNKEMVDWVARVASKERDYAVTCVKRYKEFLAGDVTGCMHFPWYDTPNSNRWNSIYGGSIRPTEADKEYVRAILEAMEKGLEGKTPPPAPKPKTKERPLVTIYAEGTGPSRKYRVEHGGAQLEEGDKELLKGIDTFRSVSKELADLKAWKAKVLAAI